MKLGSNVRGMKMLTPDKQYVVFWAVVELVAISPFYYYAWKIHRGWPRRPNELGGTS